MSCGASLCPAERKDIRRYARPYRVRATASGESLTMASLSLGFGESPLRPLVERDVGGGEVLLQVRHRGGAGYQQDVGRQAQGARLPG